MKTTIELDDRDWGKITALLQERANYEDNQALRHFVGGTRDIYAANAARLREIRKEINRQRKPVSVKNSEEIKR